MVAAVAFFLPVADGQRFCLYHAPMQAGGGGPKGLVVYVHPFAEEMNKSRRMATQQARALAQAGFAVLQIDLLGCGDSSGDFGDATWAAWVADVVRACQWLRERAGDGLPSVPPLWLWGLRMGCLLAVEAAQTVPPPCNFLFWSPASSGKQLLQQFLRLKAASDLASGNAKAVMEQLRADLAQGLCVEVAGYLLAPALCSGLERAALTPTAGPGRVEWLELSSRDDATLSPVAQQGVAAWERAGYAVRSQLVHGPSFWQTTELEDAPALLAATTAALLSRTAP